jgi:hypothetical protein
MADAGNGDTAKGGAGGQASLGVIAQYVKDLSFGGRAEYPPAAH